MRRRWLALAVIVTVASGCDNVAWGGVDMRLQAPPSRDDVAVPDSPVDAPEREGDAEADEGLPDLPQGPLLLAGTRSGSSATLVVVGEIRGAGVASLPSEEEAPGFRDRLTQRLLPPGTELILFSEGVRVGRLVASETGVDERFCLPRPSVSGTVELVPPAAGATRFLAIPAPRAGERPYGSYRALSHNYDQRVASLNLASQAIPRLGAPWPPSLLESRADIRAFRLPDEDGPAIAATFLHQDRLSVAEPGSGAYALFVLGTARGEGFERAYTWYRPADEEGKGAPRYFGHLDWDGDGSSEILLDVMGAEHRWFAGLARADGSWTRTFQDPCGTGSPASGG